MPHLRTLLFAIGITAANILAAAETPLVVVVNARNPITSLTGKQVADLYLGRKRVFPEGQPALPIDQAQESPLRARFYFDLTGKPIAEINAYWARLVFSGQNTPPPTASNTLAVLEAVRNNINAIAYLEKEPVDHLLKVVLVIPPRP